MAKSPTRRRLADAYTFPGFRPLQRVHGLFGEPGARLVTLVRRGKKRSAEAVAQCIAVGTTAGAVGCEICPAPVSAFTSIWRYVGSTAGGAGR